MPKAFEFETKSINTKDIIVDELGQRDVDRRNSQFRKIMSNFDPNLVQDIQVAFIDGKYYCFDGQMTKKVLIARNGGNDLCVRCKVHYGMTKMDAADMFVKQRGIVSRVDITDKLRVMANYGDKEVIDFIRTTERNGLDISWNGSKCKDAVVAVHTLYNEYKAFHDLDAYGQMIRIIKGAWNGDPEGAAAPILRGMSLFLRTYKGKFKEDVLIQKLSRKRPEEIIRDARVDKSTGARKYAVQILLAYNFGQREDARLKNIL